uniref:Ankyrin repeat domain-containing protein SOWAHA-like n=1 Tax=Crassostrea virginica TaxID=6565 RepID=A0A8B8E5H6_CRAVI|nr:ankyrin repeat domain-containing protein SOWAHA-like [Crassostrea virginica]
MAASGFSLEAVKNFMIENDCKVTNHELVTNFKSYLNDPDEKAQKYNREKFKEFVNTLAGIKTDERGEKILVLKKKFRPDHTSADLSKQDPNVSASPEASLGVSQVQDDSTAKCESETTSSQQSEGPSEGNSNHLSNTSSVASVASTNSGPATSEDDANVSTVSVKERALHLNRMESETELQKMTEGQRSKGQRTVKDRDGDPDEDSQSSGSCLVSLDSEEKEWIVASSSSDYHPMHKMLNKNPKLVNVKDFTSGVTKHGKPEVIKLLASLGNVDINRRTVRQLRN